MHALSCPKSLPDGQFSEAGQGDQLFLRSTMLLVDQVCERGNDLVFALRSRIGDYFKSSTVHVEPQFDLELFREPVFEAIESHYGRICLTLD